MPFNITLTGQTPRFDFKVHSINEAKSLGYLSTYQTEGTHEEISHVFTQGEGHMLLSLLIDCPDAILIQVSASDKRPSGIVALRPKKKLLIVPEDLTDV